MRKSYTGKFKAKVAIDVILEQETVTELSSKYQVHHTTKKQPFKLETGRGMPKQAGKLSFRS